MELFNIFIPIALIIGLMVVNIVAMWKLFEDHDVPGLFIFVPVYGTYKQFKIAECVKEFKLMIISFLTYIALSLGFSIFINDIYVLCICKLLALIALNLISIVCQANYCISISRMYGRKSLFAVGLLLLPLIFTPVMVFKKKGANA